MNRKNQKRKLPKYSDNPEVHLNNRDLRSYFR